jgi:hypothetical protein
MFLYRKGNKIKETKGETLKIDRAIAAFSKAIVQVGIWRCENLNVSVRQNEKLGDKQKILVLLKILNFSRSFEIIEK